MSKLLLCLLNVILIVTLGCQPNDKNVQPYRGATARQANLEKSAVKGVDYLLYIGARLTEIKNFSEFVLRTDLVATKVVNGAACGQLIVDRTDGQHQMLRTTTQNCEVSKGLVESLNLKADGEDTFDVWRDMNGAVLRVVGTSVSPVMISGKISKGDLRNSLLKLYETHEFSMDQISSDVASGTADYRITSSVRWDWRQELAAPTFKAFETGQQNLSIRVVAHFVGSKLASLQVEDLRLSAYAPREISRSKRARADTPNVNYHKLELFAQSAHEKDQPLESITFEPSCGRPNGRLEILNFDTTVNDDKIRSKAEPAIQYSEKGVEVPAAETVVPWAECQQKQTANQLLTEVPYPILFFK